MSTETSDSRQRNPHPSRPEIHLRRAGLGKYALTDDQGNAIVAGAATFVEVRR